jgi:hypothetical protein
MQQLAVKNKSSLVDIIKIYVCKHKMVKNHHINRINTMSIFINSGLISLGNRFGALAKRLIFHLKYKIMSKKA